MAPASHLDLWPGAGAPGSSRTPSTAPRVAVLRAGRSSRPGVAPRRLAEQHCEVVELHIDRLVIDRLAALQPSLVLIELDGARFELLRLCRSVRAVTGAWIIVTSSDPLDDALVVDALDAGADDVVANASPPIVDARVRVGLRIHPVQLVEPPALVVGDVLIDLRAHELRIAGDAVRCPPVQFELLVALARHVGAAVRSTDLLRTIWGNADEPNPRRLRIAVSAARHILGSAPARPRLETVTKVGYRFVAPDPPAPAELEPVRS